MSKQIFKAINFKNIKNYICRAICAFDSALCKNRLSLVINAFCALFLNACLEIALRKSLWGGLRLIIQNPVNFFFNALIIFAVYSIMYLIRHRLFWWELTTIIFATVSIVSRVLMSYRTTPFNMSDFRIIRSALSIIPIYLTTLEIIGICIAVVLAVTLLVFSFIKCKKCDMPLKASALITAAIIITTSSFTALYLEFRLDSDRFSNLPNAYRSYGFNICFFCSIFDQGIQKPKDYTPERVENMLEMISQNVENKKNHNQSVSNPLSADKPNIIFLQLESFYDVNKIEGYTYSKNPIPIFTALKNSCPNGLFRVPSIGAGTANTEFEVLTGMEVACFGVAEYPYYSVLQTNTCESLAYNTRLHGYTAHAIHNHRGTFYDRNKVFANLGFDTFTSLENMPDIQKNRRNWAKDSMLTSQIRLALDSSPENPDFIYTISVQPHGKYPGSWESYENLLDGTLPEITVSGNDDNPENAGFSYYVNELYETDIFAGSVLAEVISRNEPTILVMFGDHMPAFTVQNWTVTDGDYYTTDFVIWNNCGIDFSDTPSELTSYQIGAYILSKLGITDGSMNKLNQLYIGTGYDYSSEREMLEYDLLYGDKTAIGAALPYSPSNIKYGLAKIYVTNISSLDDVTYIKGENFNTYSTVTINGKLCDTSFIDKNTLVMNQVPDDGDMIGVVQLAGNHTVLGESLDKMVFRDSMIQHSEQQNSFGGIGILDVIEDLVSDDSPEETYGK